jgi:ABC-2 type transport system ATP-binding protein
MSAVHDAIQPTTSAVSLRGISKTYSHFRLENIDLDFQTGTVHGLIGPNGAGKSTIMRILMGLVAPEHGSVAVLGQPVSSRDAMPKRDIGYFADDMRLYKSESLAFHMQLVRSLYPTWDDAYARELLDRFGLIAQQRVKGLSQGQRVKAMLLLILARHPRLLILDEPTNGLDPVAKHEVISALMEAVQDESRTILYSSHHTQDVEQICDTITFIDRGRVIASDERDAFLNHWRRFKLQVPDGWIPPTLPGLHLDSAFGSLRVMTTDRYEASLAERLQASGATLESSAAMTLEEIFVAAVMRGREEHSR